MGTPQKRNPPRGSVRVSNPRFTEFLVMPWKKSSVHSATNRRFAGGVESPRISTLPRIMPGRFVGLAAQTFDAICVAVGVRTSIGFDASISVNSI